MKINEYTVYSNFPDKADLRKILNEGIKLSIMKYKCRSLNGSARGVFSPCQSVAELSGLPGYRVPSFRDYRNSILTFCIHKTNLKKIINISKY